MHNPLRSASIPPLIGIRSPLRSPLRSPSITPSIGLRSIPLIPPTIEGADRWAWRPLRRLDLRERKVWKPTPVGSLFWWSRRTQAHGAARARLADGRWEMADGVHRRSRTTPMTNEEKRARVEAELNADAARSDSAIAKTVGVVHDFVGRVRARLETQGVVSKQPPPNAAPPPEKSAKASDILDRTPRKERAHEARTTIREEREPRVSASGRMAGDGLWLTH